ncbi:restriction endonuclease subunit S [Serratia marcescens]|uniref:restriction endonuclease subunit S n=1 Tax=Serratia marcescens TaxID=615 RepID=UPI003F5CD37F
MSKVALKRLGDLITLKRGYDLPEKVRIAGPYPVISSAGVSGWHNEYKVEGPGVVTGRYGTLGEMYYVEEEYWPHNTALYVQDFKGNDPKYIYYLLSCLGRIRTSDKSAVPGVNRNELHEMAVPAIEDLTSQKKLREVLESIDEKIALNNRINAELEAMAKTLYDYWFVQFDFPDANGKPYNTSGGKMVYNATLGQEIPAGWSIDTLSGWIADDKTGDWGKENREGNYTLQVNCIRGADINGLNGYGNTSMPVRYILGKNEKKLLSAYDCVIEISGGSPTQSTGRMAFITKEMLDRFSYPVICSNFCKAITLKDKLYFYNFAYTWNNIYNKGILFGWEGKTSGIKNLLFDSFVDKYYVCIPHKDLVKKFHDIMVPLHQKKQKNLKENADLVKFRDWLLPMLMNGQVTLE